MASTGAALAQVVVAASTVAADLTDRHHVQAVVQLAVSCPRESVPDSLSDDVAG
jgi:hypothetical protein